MSPIAFSLITVLLQQARLLTALPLDATNIPQPPPQNEDGDSLIELLLLILFAFLFIGGFVVGLVLVVKLIITTLTFNPIKLDHQIPGSLDDEYEIEERIRELSPNEQNLYRAGQEYLKNNPIDDSELPLSDHIQIQEKGIQAWQFQPSFQLQPESILVNNKTELTFLNYDYQCSVQTNLPIPKINEVYYFEMKIYTLDDPETTLISAGLSTKPYPYFRLPGRHLYSIAYDSNGSRRYSTSFKLSTAQSSVFPTLIQGDVIGIGYRVRSGTIFFTRNGKKLSEKTIGGHIKGMKLQNLYPTIGANNPCSLHVNLGQAGFVFIEANVKKWGYAAKEGNGPPLPSYGDSSEDLLLDSSNEDEDELVPPPDFFSGVRYESREGSRVGSISENFTLNSIEGLPMDPPLYASDENENEEEEAEEARNERLLLENTTRNQFITGQDQTTTEEVTELHDNLSGTTEETTATTSNEEEEEEEEEIEIEEDDDDDKSMNLNDETHNTSDELTDTNTAHSEASIHEENQYEANVLGVEEMESSRDD
ncbi:hypothetical protein WICPIJ_005971 [Wickerhamomyces pijperi]|uniref:B30.2/SPRY domain-containing protein n=1 Tax=Wickerhamomyces pijperi TaxID=599730 RepID=A0A9P8Q332_WICPI|nr:hypothetical protein WICPIJ_005971 [Wickerhamomyces pijperi]